MAATQVGLPSMQESLGISVTASQWILNLTLMVLAGIATVGGALGDRLGRLRMFILGIIGTIVGALIVFCGGLMTCAPVEAERNSASVMVVSRLLHEPRSWE